MSGSAIPTQWTTRSLLGWMATAFGERQLDAPRLSAELLLAHVLGVERMRLYMEADRPASEAERAALRDLVRRALAHEPIQYLVGTWPFFGLELKVDRRALIPRPCTEQIAELVVQRGRNRPAGEPIRIADVGTGTGCLALALAKALPAAEVTATDLSTDALDLAQENAEALGLAGRITFVSGDGLAPVAGQTFDWLVSNPPYIPDAEWDEVAPNVRDHEPELALRGGHDGLAVLRPVLEGAASVLVPGGWLMVEAAASNAAAAADLARAGGLVEVELIHDFEGHPRFVLAQRTASSV